MRKMTAWLLAAAAFLPVVAVAQIDARDPSATWMVVPPDVPPPPYLDTFSDQVNGTKEVDLIGGPGAPVFMTKFWDGGTPGNLTDGQLAFRFRTGRGDGAYNQGRAIVGIDMLEDGLGDVDLLIGIRRVAWINRIRIWSPSGASTTPQNTRVGTLRYSVNGAAATYSFASVGTIDSIVPAPDIDGGGADYFLSFRINFNQVVTNIINFVSLPPGFVVNQNSPVRYVGFTITTAGAYQDIIGPNGIAVGTWSAIGAFSNPTTFDGDLPTVVKLSYFRAKFEEDHISLSWKTETETDCLGFHLWRSEMEDPYIRITGFIIPSQGGSTWGAEYSYADFSISPGKTYHYKLQDIAHDGKEGWHGPVAAQR